MAAYWDLVCEACGHHETNVACSLFAPPACPRCTGERKITDGAEYHPFIPYFDFALGKQIDSLAERRTAMRGEIDRNTGERRGQMDYRDKMTTGEINARKDRAYEAHRERNR